MLLKNNSNYIHTIEKLKEKSLTNIDFDGIRTLLANQTTTEMSKILANQLKPSNDPSIIKTLLKETSEGRLLIDSGNIPYLNGLENISELLRKIKLGGILTGIESLQIASSLEKLHSLQEAINASSHDLVQLRKYTLQMTNLSHVSHSIKSKISNDGSVKDSATYKLTSIRSKIRKNYTNVVNRLSDIINAPDLDDTIQDNVISVRGDRLVIQVKTSMQHKIPGVIHGASNTGMTQFIEPLETIGLCNDWRKSSLEEDFEIAQILTEISNKIREHYDDIDSNFIMAVELDLIIAKSKLSAEIKAIKQANHDIESNNIKLISVIHPLLEGNPKSLTLNLSEEHKVLVITGPNTGGKTVALKTIGLLAAMQQSGIHITGQPGTHIPLFDGIYTDIGDQQSIENSVSTFSSHIETLKTIISVSTSKSLVLLDEIGASTDPEEGSAIGSTILEYFAEKNITTIATTHHNSIVTIAKNNPKMKNASFHLNPDNLLPTYELQENISGKSYALSIASHIGLPDEIINHAIQKLSPETREINTQLEEIILERKTLAAALVESQKCAENYKSARKILDSEIQYITSHRDQIFTEVRLTAKKQFKHLTDLVSKAKSNLSWNSMSNKDSNASKMMQDLSKISDELKNIRIPDTNITNRISYDFKSGDLVLIKDINTKGILFSIDHQSHTALIKVGNSKLKVSTSRIFALNINYYKSSIPSISKKYPKRNPIDPGKTILDIRGNDVTTAINKIDSFINSAIKNDLVNITIIHGKGTGILRKYVRENLSHHTLVKTFTPKLDAKGGDGATDIILV
jgi:DNA mismatch repair protein MutS2